MTTETSSYLRWDDHPMLEPGGPFELAQQRIGGVDVTVFATQPSSTRALLEASAGFGDRIAFTFDDRSLSFAEVVAKTANVAAYLADRHGVGPGSRVALISANRAEWILTYLAVTSLGGVAVAFNGWWTGTEIADGIALTRPSLVIADRARLARIADDDFDLPTITIEDEFAAIEQFDSGGALPSTEIEPDSPATILFTSGTTGRAKAAVLSHRSLLMLVTSTAFVSARTIAEYPDAIPTNEPCSLVQLPLFHVSGLQGMYHTLGLGTRSVWPTGRFDEERVLALTEELRVTVWSLMATQLLRILEHEAFDRYDLSSLFFVGGGGSAWPAELLRLVHEKLPRAAAAMTFGFGQTETGGMGTVNAGANIKRYPDSVGVPRPTVEVEIRDADGRTAAQGVEGDIYMRGPYVFLEYWDDPEATAATIGQDGWLRTGDIGRVENGVLYIASRRTDLIIRGGENIYPAEIENRLLDHPGVVECAVYGIADRVYGQQVKAVVVEREGATLDADEVRRFLAGSLAPFKMPAEIEVTREPLPRTATGKVMKHVLQGAVSNLVEE